MRRKCQIDILSSSSLEDLRHFRLMPMLTDAVGGNVFIGFWKMKSQFGVSSSSADTRFRINNNPVGCNQFVFK